MWWDMSASRRSEFEHWHTHEHFPERLGIPGFRRATRWTSAAGDEGIFVMYELDDYDVLASPAYLTRLNAPTAWSTRLMPEHRNMVRSQCRVLESRGINAARNQYPIGNPVGVSTNLLLLGGGNRWCLVAQEMKPGEAGLERNVVRHAAYRGAQLLVSAECR